MTLIKYRGTKTYLDSILIGLLLFIFFIAPLAGDANAQYPLNPLNQAAFYTGLQYNYNPTGNFLYPFTVPFTVNSLWPAQAIESFILQRLFQALQLQEPLGTEQATYRTSANFYVTNPGSSYLSLPQTGVTINQPTSFITGQTPVAISRNVQYTVQSYDTQQDLLIPFAPIQSVNAGNITPSGLLNQVLLLNYYGNSPLLQQYIQNSTYYAAGLSGGGIRIAAAPGAETVLANPDYGMYCWDPVLWIDGGSTVGIWCKNIPIRAQSFDKRGRLVDDSPSFSVEPTGETGIMFLLDAPISLYRGVITATASMDYLVTVNVDTASVVTVAKRRYATCDSCHPTPPGHISVPLSWGNCHECHNLGDKLHRHAYKAGIAIDNCYKCHPSGCLSGAHGQLNIWCTTCHGTLEDAAYGRMGISGQRGKPQCADCHDLIHAEPGDALFVDSQGHGGVWCINCHGATHVELAKPVGLNNCTFCHTVQANIPWMGSNCARCHGSSFSPHLVTD